MQVSVDRMATRLVNWFDDNGDGRINLSTNPLDGGELSGKTLEEDRRLLGRMDAAGNNNGYLSQAEIRDFLSRFDGNGDALIGYREAEQMPSLLRDVWRSYQQVKDPSYPVPTGDTEVPTPTTT